ncbi:MAG: Gfo/Idh/MocA family oxidoreductase [Anaerolineae bacterium]|nr:Gfo/Idh/MocA family oxidoreductase [Anaerolineae bacterium]
MKTLRLGLIGAGFVAHFYARALEQVRGVEIAGITSRTWRRAEELAMSVRERGLGEALVYESVGGLARGVDALAICAPNDARVQIMEEIAAAVQQGAELLGVMCEKPLARNLKEARRLVALADGLELKTAYLENQILMKPVRAQLAQLASVQQEMGPPVLARSAEEHGGPHAGWFWDPTQQGGGVLLDMGCHSIAAAWYALTPPDKPLTFLRPVSISARCALLKWGLPQWRRELLSRYGVDYALTPAEDFATGTIIFEHPDSGQRAMAQFTNSWMFEKQGLRLLMDGMGPGYAFEVNTLLSPVQIFVGDAAAEAVADAELALEKSTASRGLLAVQYNEPDLYGYTDELEEAAQAFLAGRDGCLPWSYGLEITRLIMAAYLSAERGCTLDLTDPEIQRELDTYVPLIQQGRGREVLHVP